MGCSLLFLSSSALLFLLSLRLLLLFYCCSSSSSSSSSSPSSSSTSSPSDPCGHSTNPSPSTALSLALSLIWGGSSTYSTGCYSTGCSSPASHSPTSPQVYYRRTLGCQGIFSFRVPGPAQGAARVVSGPHIVPNTSAAAGGVSTLHTTNCVMAAILMTEDTAAMNGGSGNLLSPGGRHTDFMFISVASWWWGR